MPFAFFDMHVCVLAQKFLKILLHYRNFLDSSYPEHGKQHIRTCVKMTSHVVKKLTSLHHPKSKGNKS